MAESSIETNGAHTTNSPCQGANLALPTFNCPPNRRVLPFYAHGTAPAVSSLPIRVTVGSAGRVVL